ncbi:MAG TPA: prepilin-type N-terminal cleavage/methylation domain-containing protein [Firmicutes bacterium]|nr:prepilin-type N-terminal cleavage/methylation domain-containing protein [Bacillota bacterium]
MLRITKKVKGIFGRIKGERGFTLVELLIVLAIIGVLASIAVPSITKAVNSAKEKACQANIMAIEAAAHLYYVDNNTYPAKVEDLKDYFKDSEIPECPFGANYEYKIDSTTGEVTHSHTPQQSQ